MKTIRIDIENWKVADVIRNVNCPVYEPLNNFSGVFEYDGETSVYMDEVADEHDAVKRLVQGLEDGEALEDGFQDEIETLHASCQEWLTNNK